jgi:formate/nitrite transporter FocA (FNT family)
MEMFIGGFFCGMLIHFAVKCKVSYLTVMAVVIFILIGAEHCVADFPYLLITFSLENVIKLGLVVLGNSIGALIIEGLISDE